MLVGVMVGSFPGGMVEGLARELMRYWVERQLTVTGLNRGGWENL
jgi:hypothetical protein